ncbi:uncharacterized protein LOC143343915 isoform X2 [Colletes latitarsis]|uniref:uncharacterized protein LOC143343915 isoform X2 n=1 Tax=Colletes latitarsis TaxID=2605962 RepID=UPI0040352F99
METLPGNILPPNAKCKPTSPSSKPNARRVKHAWKIVQPLQVIWYKREQTRTIKGLQSQRQYKSPFPWYNIVNEMLAKVIDDEKKTSSEMILKAKHLDASVLKSLSSDSVRDSLRKKTKAQRIRPCTAATCDEIVRRSKLTRSDGKSDPIPDKVNEAGTKYVPCPKARTLRSISKDPEEDRLSNHRPTRDTESKATGYPVTVPYTSINSTPDDIIGGSNKNYEPQFLQCPLCGWEDAKYKQSERNTAIPVQAQRNFIPCSDYYSGYSQGRYTACTGCDRKTISRSDYSNKYADDSGDFKILRDLLKQAPIRSTVKSVKDVDVEVQCDKEAEKVIEDGILVRGPVQSQIVQFDPALTNKFQGATIEACTRLEIVLSSSKGTEKQNRFPTQSICQNTQGIQCMKSKSSTKGTQFSSKIVTPVDKTKEAGVNTVNCVERETQSTICVSDRTRRCISLQTLSQHCVKDPVRTMESKEVTVNIIDKASKGIQSTICVSRGNLARSSSFERAKDTETTPFVHKIHSVATNCLDRHVGTNAQCLSLTRAKSHESITCCIQHADSKESQQFETPCKLDTCPRNISEIIKDPTVAFMLQQLLYKMLSSRIESSTQNTKSLKTSDAQTDHRPKCNEKRNCKVDVTEMVGKIKEFATKALGSKQIFAEAEAPSAVVHKPTMIEKSDFDPLFESTGIIEDKVQRFSADETGLLKEGNKFLAVNKEVSVHSESRDIGTSRSSSQLPVCDVGVQYGSRSLEDSACTNKYEMNERERVSVGTQKRDPILVRLIKCNESQTIMRFDKETLTSVSDVDLGKRYIDKHVETCGRSTCLSSAVYRKLKGLNTESAYEKKYKYQLESDDRQRSYKNYICDKNCKDNSDQDWTDVTNMESFRNPNNSKIPLCVRPRKCTFANCK